jgi:hypothetical protein
MQILIKILLQGGDVLLNWFVHDISPKEITFIDLTFKTRWAIC